MLDQQDGLALHIQRTDAVDDKFEQGRIDARCGFVKQDHLGVGHQDPRQFEELALATRQHARRLVLQFRQKHEIEQPPRLVHRRPFFGGDLAAA